MHCLPKGLDIILSSLNSLDGHLFSFLYIGNQGHTMFSIYQIINFNCIIKENRGLWSIHNVAGGTAFLGNTTKCHHFKVDMENKMF